MANAPRFRAYLSKATDSPILHMARQAWDNAVAGSTSTAILDLERTPLARVAIDASVVVAYAERQGTSGAEISVVRYDEADAPEVYNTDKYSVYVDFQDDPRYLKMVTAASTEDNQNLRDYLKENVFLAKQRPDTDHRRRELPLHIRLLMGKQKGKSPV